MNYKKIFFEFWILDPFTGIPWELYGFLFDGK